MDEIHGCHPWMASMDDISRIDRRSFLGRLEVALGSVGGSSRVDPESFWGRFGVDLGRSGVVPWSFRCRSGVVPGSIRVDPGSTLGRSGVDPGRSGSIRVDPGRSGSIQGRSGVDLGSIQSRSRADLGSKCMEKPCNWIEKTFHNFHLNIPIQLWNRLPHPPCAVRYPGRKGPATSGDRTHAQSA